MESQDILTQVGVGAAAVVAAFLAYFGKKVPSLPDRTTTAVVAGVGLELGNRAQMDQVISQLTRIADYLEALADQDRAEQRDMLQDILNNLQKERKT